MDKLVTYNHFANKDIRDKINEIVDWINKRKKAEVSKPTLDPHKRESLLDDKEHKCPTI